MSAEPQPTISVVIPTYNRADVLRRTIECFAAQRYAPDRYEVLVIDNSTDATSETVERLAREVSFRLRLVRTADPLPAVKRNLGLRHAEGSLVLFFNDDLWAEPQLLSEHAASHRTSGPGPLAVLGHIEQSPKMPWTPFNEWYRPFAYSEIADRADRDVTYRSFWSANISLPRDQMISRNLVFHEGWAEIAQPGGKKGSAGGHAHEDIELGWRWTEAGGRIVYNPRARGEHYHPHTLDGACRLQQSIGRGLRDLEQMVGDPGLLERYGVFSWRNRPRAVVRGLVRQVLFNALTVPVAKAWLESRSRNSAVTRWMYWKVLLHYTDRGYRSASAGAHGPARPLTHSADAIARGERGAPQGRPTGSTGE